MLSRRLASSISNWFLIPCNLSTSSSAARRWDSAVDSSYCAASSSLWDASSAALASSSFRCISAVRLFSRSSSAARLRTPALRLVEPPVMEPPRLITCPSSVTIRNAFRYFRAMAIPQSRSSAITVLPRRLLKILVYFGSKRTSRDATPTKPNSCSTPRSRSSSPRMAVRGRKVALPPSRCFRKAMALLASSSRSTTMFCKPAPRAISMAREYLPSVFIRLATGP